MLQAAVFFDPEFSQLNSADGIHVEEADRCPTRWRPTGDDSTGESEVIVPVVSSRMEQFDDGAGLWINA